MMEYLIRAGGEETLHVPDQHDKPLCRPDAKAFFRPTMGGGRMCAKCATLEDERTTR
jgi:hypothetical protein